MDANGKSGRASRRLIYELREAFRIALQAIHANKSRAILTTLGIIIGITAVSTTMTVMVGMRTSFESQLSAMGSDVLFVSKRPWITSDDWWKYRNRKRITLAESEKLADKLGDKVEAVNPSVGTARPIKFQSKVLEDVRINGTTEKNLLTTSAVPEYGRYITGLDVRSSRYVCVIGSEVHEKLFEQVDPIGKKMKIGPYRFTVVGVMEKQGSFLGALGGPSLDNQVVIPITTFIKSLGSRRGIQIAVKVWDPSQMDDVESEMVAAMRQIRKLPPIAEDSFSINKQAMFINMYDNIMGIVGIMGILITGISLFVGGIGVMNVMFVSVTERTKEIGIRKAIGAKRRSILIQFLLEAIMICLMGCVVALLLSYGASELINIFFAASLSTGVVVVAIVVSILVGVSSGFFPALKASKLNPIESLRYE